MICKLCCHLFNIVNIKSGFGTNVQLRDVAFILRQTKVKRSFQKLIQSYALLHTIVNNMNLTTIALRLVKAKMTDGLRLIRALRLVRAKMTDGLTCICQD